MAASSEIRFKIGADTSALSKAFVAVQSVAATAGAQIQKKLGMKDALKGIFQGIGIGSVQSITDMIVAPFQHAAERAKALANLTDHLRENTFKWLGALGGPTRELELQVKYVNDLNRDIETQRALVARLGANPLRFMTEANRQELADAETALDELIKKQDDIATSTKIAVLAENRRTEELKRQATLANWIADAESKNFAQGRIVQARREAIETEYEILKTRGAMPSVLQENRNALAALNHEEARANRLINDQVEAVKRTGLAQREQAALELKDAGERAQALAKLTALRREYDVLVTKNKRLSPEAQTNRNEQNAVKAQLDLLDKAARRDRAAALTGLGQTMTGGTVGRRSERERLADRGAEFATRADAAIRSGATPAYVARLVSAANRDFQTVGGKVRASTSAVARDDATSLGGQLITANETLKKIEANLAPSSLK